MKIQVASDLHLEFLLDYFPGDTLIRPAPDADVLILAGDIGVGTLAIDLFAKWPVPVLYVAGNHEFYRQHMPSMRQKLREACAGTSVQFLDNDAIEISTVRFLGATLWTDYQMRKDILRSRQMSVAAQCLNDHRIIMMDNDVFSPLDALSEHEKSRAWLASELRKPFHGKTVVITHHGCHPNSIHPKYVGDELNAAFASDLSDLIPMANLWIHGHVHDNFSYRISGCQIVTNPAGYALDRHGRTAAEVQLENGTFQHDLVIDLNSLE